MLRPSIRCILAGLSLGLTAAPLSCIAAGDGEGLEGDIGDDSFGAVSVPSKGTADTLDIVAWNIEWFGHTGFGPTDEALQLENVRDVIQGTDADIWALEEVVTAAHWNNLKAQLPGYAGLISNEAAVTQGSAYYTSSEQKVGILYKTSVASVQSAKIILTNQDFNFGGRPPLEVKLTVNLKGATTNLVFIVFHAKAMADADSYNRRSLAASALKAYLDSTYPTERVIVLGDYNDDLDASIWSGAASPYKSLVDDPAHYFFPTKAFTDAGIGTTASSSTPIDHHMITSALSPLYVAGSAEVYKLKPIVPQYTTTTSDHYPVITKYSFASLTPKLILNEICANEPGSATSGEFVEIVNVGGGTADLTGYGLHDSTGLRHAFASGTTLAPGKAITVFGGVSGIPAGLANAIGASSGGLSLANGGDAVTLKDSLGAAVDTFTYGSPLAATDGVSMNRSPDMAAGGAWALHTAVAAAPSSPGKKASGGNF